MKHLLNTVIENYTNLVLCLIHFIFYKIWFHLELDVYFPLYKISLSFLYGLISLLEKDKSQQSCKLILWVFFLSKHMFCAC